MSGHTPHQSRVVPQVMVSSTFTDLQQHRTVPIEAIHRHNLHANVMEDDSAKLLDEIESSLQMVRDSAAYIGARTPYSPFHHGRITLGEKDLISEPTPASKDSQMSSVDVPIAIARRDSPVNK